MKSFLVRRWFLLLLLGSVSVAGLWPASVAWTNRLDPRWIVAPALFLAAWGLESRSLARSLLRPLPALWAVLLSYGLLPALGWLVGQLLPDDGLRIGLLIIASVPCTLASAVLWTRMAGGADATALLVILLTTSLSWLATTLWLANATGTSVAIDSTNMMLGLVMVLVVPVGLGQALRAVGPLARVATRGKAALGVASQLLILLMLLKAAADVGSRLRDESLAVSAGGLLATALLCLLTHLLGLAGGFWSSRALGFDRASQIAVAFSCSQKTLPVAVFLFDAYFREYPLAVVPMLCYHVGQLVVDTFIADGLAHRAPAVADLPAEATV